MLTINDITIVSNKLVKFVLVFLFFSYLTCQIRKLTIINIIARYEFIMKRKKNFFLE